MSNRISSFVRCCSGALFALVLGLLLSPASAEAGQLIILGALDSSLIQGVVQGDLEGIKACYEEELQRDLDLAGKITVKFTIAADGSVSSASTDRSTLGNEAVEGCVNAGFSP